MVAPTGIEGVSWQENATPTPLSTPKQTQTLTQNVTLGVGAAGVILGGALIVLQSAWERYVGARPLSFDFMPTVGFLVVAVGVGWAGRVYIERFCGLTDPIAIRVCKAFWTGIVVAIMLSATKKSLYVRSFRILNPEPSRPIPACFIRSVRRKP